MTRKLTRVVIRPSGASPETQKADPGAKLGWAEMRRLLRMDLDLHSHWILGVDRTWPAWRRFVAALVFGDTFAANVVYRLQTYLYETGYFRCALLLARLNGMLFSVRIGLDVRIGGGLYIAHGQVVMDGKTRVGRNASIGPFVTLGLSNGSDVAFGASGPDIGDDIVIGTGAKLLGPIRIGHRVLIGANAVVLSDVPDDHSAAGVPARSWPSRPRFESSSDTRAAS